MKFTTRLLAIIAAVVLIFGSLLSLFDGRPFMGIEAMLRYAAIAVGLGIVLGPLLYLALRACAWSITPTGFEGRRYLGPRTHIEWADIVKAGQFSLHGLPALFVTSGSSEREIIAYTLGVDFPAVHVQLVRHAGPDHVLTRCFRPDAD
ncbi:hypothetical protein [Arenimonas daejeonensis]|uniref:hypothetical protein n=1 Tax=Arenimonas daejeonensis TaxID=370777 RepID=UPI001315077B|nr:hypothetical protein [Arenimonas daejeonensis]